MTEKTHHIWQTESPARPDCMCNDCAQARRVVVEARMQRIQAAVDAEIQKARAMAEPRPVSLVERDLVCPACRRHFGRILAPVGAEVRPVCDGCVLEGRM